MSEKHEERPVDSNLCNADCMGPFADKTVRGLGSGLDGAMQHSFTTTWPENGGNRK